jgi:hypothetical protein
MRENPHSEGKETAYSSKLSDTAPHEGEQAGNHGTAHDAKDMHRLGKKQEFQVCFVRRLLRLNRI